MGSGRVGGRGWRLLGPRGPLVRLSMPCVEILHAIDITDVILEGVGHGSRVQIVYNIITTKLFTE